MSSPPRKRLKQASIEYCFHKQKSVSEKPTVVVEDCVEEDREVEMATNNANPDISERRRLQLEAAERRQLAGTPDRTPPRQEDVPSTSFPKDDTSKNCTVNNKDKSPGSVCSDTLEIDASQDLFSGEESSEFSSQSRQQSGEAEVLMSCIETADEESPSKGMKKNELKSQPSCSFPLPELQYDTSSQTVLFNCKLRGNWNKPPSPFPHNYRDTWDSSHVHMPCSDRNEYPVPNKSGHREIGKRWSLIQRALKRDIRNTGDLEKAILSYNTRHESRWDFSSLHTLFNSVFEREETEAFFRTTLPRMTDLALRLPELCTRPIPLLKQDQPHSIFMTQQQAACLLANAFFCTFPKRNTRQKQSEYSAYPDINFNQLFLGSKHSNNRRKVEKLKCIINYFRRVTTNMPTGTLSYRRQRLGRFPNWKTSNTKLTGLHVTSNGTIEDDGIGMLQVDFANKFLGGGVLGHGCVQEEIRFLICPEMILSRLFTQVLEKDECLIMTGCERFSNYSGYADSFSWTGNHEDPTPRDEWGRRYTEVVAIDACVFRANSNRQFSEYALQRELNKAYCGFLTPGVNREHLSAVATGNWGCGAFGGDHMLKALIQLMAAAENQRDVCYFTFGNRSLRDRMHRIHTFIQEKQLAISDLWALVQEYNTKYCQTPWEPPIDLFKFIEKTCRGDISDSEEEEPVGLSTYESQELAYLREEEDWAASTP